MSHDAACLLIAHGTRNPRGAEEMDELLAVLRDRCDLPAEAGWLEEFAEPDAVTGAGRLVKDGYQRIVTLPFLVLGAGHAKTDVPAVVAAVRARYPDVGVAHGRVLGLHPRLFALARERIGAVSDPTGRTGEALLVTAAGSSDPDANGDLAKAARFLAEGTGHRWVDTAYAGVTWPTADVALRRMHAAGVRRVVLFSWSLLAGTLERRVTGWADEVAAETGLEVVDAGRFGPHPLVAEAVADRYEEALHGDVRMNCDLCAYRVPLPGLEGRVSLPSAGGTGRHVHAARRSGPAG